MTLRFHIEKFTYDIKIKLVNCKFLLYIVHFEYVFVIGETEMLFSGVLVNLFLYYMEQQAALVECSYFLFVIYCPQHATIYEGRTAIEINTTLIIVFIIIKRTEFCLYL